MDVYIGQNRAAFDSHGWAGIAFVLAYAIDHYHGILIHDFKPGAGGSKAALEEEFKSNGMGSYLRPILRRTKPDVLEAACWLAFRYYKAANGESHT